jgi:hypothetical protein
MNGRRALAIVPAAFMVIGILVIQTHSPRQSAPTPATANPIGAAFVASEDASVASDLWPERMTGGTDEAGSGAGEPSPTVTATPVPTLDGGEAQQDEQQSSNLPVVGSSPTPAITETATVVTTALSVVTTEPESNDLWGAIVAAFPPSEVETAYWVAMCESSGNPEAVGRSGERGAWQILEVYHGPVPEGLYAQALHAAEVLAINGWGIWSCA